MNDLTYINATHDVEALRFSSNLRTRSTFLFTLLYCRVKVKVNMALTLRSMITFFISKIKTVVKLSNTRNLRVRTH